MTLATRIGVLEHGALVQVGTPQQIYRDPVSSYVAARLGSPRINLLPRAATGACRRRPAAATVGVRPDGTRLAPGQRPRQRPRAARWCGASSTSATRRTCTSRSAATAEHRAGHAVPATPAASSPAARCRSNSPRRCGSTPRASASRLNAGARRWNLQQPIIEAGTQTLIDHVEELTALDPAIGDGDHGLNMKRGALAIQAKLARAGRPRSLNDALKTMGMTCMSTVGGSSGPVFGTLMVTLGKELPRAAGARRRGRARWPPASPR